MKGQQAYLVSLADHIRYVQEAGKRIGVPLSRLDIHDQSKYEKEEFVPYANYFWNEDGTPRTERNNDLNIEYAFTLAWMHHLQHNDHHWQHWIFPDRYANKMLLKKKVMTPNGVVRMPEICVREMIADWMGASMAYTGSWDMVEWLTSNTERVVLHPRSAVMVRECLINLNTKYKFMNDLKFKDEDIRWQ